MPGNRHPSHRALALFATIAAATLAACDPEKCPGDMWEYEPAYGVCVMVTPPTGDGDTGDGDSGDGDGEMPDSGMIGDGDGAAPFEFGASCGDDSDCGDGICLNMPIMVGCTKTDCMPGEANAGVCPDDWMCLSGSDGMSGCVKF